MELETQPEARKVIRKIHDGSLPLGWRFRILGNRRRSGGFFACMLMAELALTWIAGALAFAFVTLVATGIGYLSFTVILLIIQGYE